MVLYMFWKKIRKVFCRFRGNLYEDTSGLERREDFRKVLFGCIDEIERSYPYVLIFVGECYGWISALVLYITLKWLNIITYSVWKNA